MNNLDAVLAHGVDAGHVPFVVAMTGNAAGVTYRGAAGNAMAGQTAGPDTVFRIFSMSKAVGSLAAMMMIERGKLTLDTPVGDILPAFDALQVLDGFDGDVPRLRAPKSRATIRQLATHTSGLEYEVWNGEIGRYLGATGHPSVLSGLKASLNYPMASDPGTRWGYGIGTDWLGQVVEAVDGRRIDAFCAAEIFGPLGMATTGFEVTPAMQPHLAGLSIRGEDGQLGPFDLGPPSHPEVYGMGHALYGTAPDYMRFLRMVLNKGQLDGRRVLSDAHMAQMLGDQMQGLAFEKLLTVAPPLSADFDPFPGTRCTHSFAFMRNEADIPGKRRAGSQTWAGLCNTHYWIDPAKDVAAVIMTQSLPFADPRFMQVYDGFERAVYAA
jgi:methyl acetate hydrolase